MTSPHANLAAALVAALADMSVVESDQTANMGTYSYTYADLGGIVKRTRPALAAHGIVALTPLHDHGNGLACTVVLLHESGERMDFGPFPFPHGRDAQATGSMVTYHRRYALVAALGMAAGKDDDGATAQPRQPEPAEDPAVPGLRTSIEAAIAKLSDKAKAELKAWFAAENLPAVRRMTADQCALALDHILSVSDELVEDQ